MVEDAPGLIDKIRKISQIDLAIVQGERERKKAERDLEEKKVSLRKSSEDLGRKRQFLSGRRSIYDREEKSIKEEQDKLVARRKALATLNNYKLQQAAEREIENVSKQLSMREDALLKHLEEMEGLEKEVESLGADVGHLKQGYDSFVREAADLFTSIEDRLGRHISARSDLLPLIPSGELAVYDRVRDRNPDNPVVPVTEGNCGGCYMQIVPQLIVQIGRGDGLVKCRGCNRILYLL